MNVDNLRFRGNGPTYQEAPSGAVMATPYPGVVPAAAQLQKGFFVMPRPDNDRYEEMMRLRVQEGLTLNEIGDLFDVSGEWVRRIVGPTAEAALRARRNKLRKKARSIKGKTAAEIAKELGISESYCYQLRAGMRHPIKGDSNLAKGIEYESYAKGLLDDMGFECKHMPNGHEFDLLINESCRIDVKSCEATKDSPTFNGVSPAWRFRVKPHTRQRCDFYLFITAKKDVFVVPSQAVPEHRTVIQFAWPTKRPELSKWQKYLERYDLIADFCRVNSGPFCVVRAEGVTP